MVERFSIRWYTWYIHDYSVNGIVESIQLYIHSSSLRQIKITVLTYHAIHYCIPENYLQTDI